MDSMRIFTLFLILSSITASAQENDPWFAFRDEKTELTGFKDKDGRVRIEPRLSGITAALRFNNIIAVMVFFTSGGLNKFIFTGDVYRQYFDDCGSANTWKQPVMALIIDHNAEKDYYQNSFEFLKTDNGYRLISLTIRNRNIR